MALISVAEALDHVLAHAAPLPAEEVPLAEADGRVLAYDLKALRTQPPADVSAMDGYAVRAADVANAPVRLKVDRRSRRRPAVHAPKSEPGEAARIFTGGVVPDGADTVVVQELTTRDGDWVEVQKPTAKGRNVRPQGLDFRQGDALLAAGHRLTARDLALAAGMNHPLLPVYRRPKSRCSPPATNSCRPAPNPVLGRSSIPTALRWRRWRARKAPRSPISASSATRSRRPSPPCATRATLLPIFW